MIINPFAQDAFNMMSLTQAINLLPTKYGRLNQMNLFPEKGVRTRTIAVEEVNGVLTLLPTAPVGSVGVSNKMGKRKVRPFSIPHIPMDDVILPSEYEGIREFGSETELKTLASVMNDHLQTAKDKFDITLEYLRMGALKGVIMDADGSVLYNLYNEFEITQKVVYFDLETDDTDVLAKCKEVVRHIEDNLKGEVYSGVYCLCSADFFDALIAHGSVSQYYTNWSNAAIIANNGQYPDPRKGFTFGGITFEEYRASAPDKDGVTRQFITDNEAHFFPVGTMSAFATIYAPADFIETVNTLGKPLYAKQVPEPMGRRVDLHVQSNPLPICYRPGLLVKGSKEVEPES